MRARPENRGNFLAVYTATVRITVHAHGAAIIREGHGTGEGLARPPAKCTIFALKAAEADATKRALATFGKPFEPQNQDNDHSAESNNHRWRYKDELGRVLIN